MFRWFMSVLLICSAGTATAQELPRVVSKDGRHALYVDGAPFLILGGQANNSSNYPAALPKVWPTIKALHRFVRAHSSYRVRIANDIIRLYNEAI